MTALQPVDRAQLDRLLNANATKGNAQDAYRMGEISEAAYQAYRAIWWYSAARFSDRPAEFPSVRVINLALEAAERYAEPIALYADQPARQSDPCTCDACSTRAAERREADIRRRQRLYDSPNATIAELEAAGLRQVPR